MPIYEYHCEECEETYEGIFPIRARDCEPKCSDCSTPMIRIASVPSLKIWDASRPFPNLSPTGDGTKTFSDEIEYKTYLTDNHMYEYAHDGLNHRPHGNQVVSTYSSNTPTVASGGSAHIKKVRQLG